MVKCPPLLSIALLTTLETTTDCFAPSMLPERIQTKVNGTGSGLAYRAQPPSPLKPKKDDKEDDGDVQKKSSGSSIHSKDDCDYDKSQGKGAKEWNGNLKLTECAKTAPPLSVFGILWQYFGMIALFISLFQLLLTTLSTITVKQCLFSPKYDAPPGAFLAESCAFEKLVPYALIFSVNIGLYYVNLYGLRGKTKGAFDELAASACD